MPRLTSCLSICLLLIASSTATAQPWADKMFETQDHDFGAVARGSKSTYSFVLKNLYKEDVHILGVRSSCGCTTPTITKRDLKTYETGEIVATFNTLTHLGHRSATLTVTIDKPFLAEVQLQVKGYIRSDVVLNPPGADFGSVDAGETPHKTINIEYAGRNDWKVVDIRCPNKFLKAEIREQRRTGSNVSYELDVTLAEGAPVGYLRDQIFLVTNDRNADGFSVTVEGQVLSPITVSPGSLFLGIVQAGQEVTKQLVVKGKQPFKIMEIECEDDCFQFETNDDARPLHLIPVTFTAGDQTGKVSQTIRIKTDLNGAVGEVLAHVQVVEAAPSTAGAKPRSEAQTSASTQSEGNPG
jgi:hypothetical protein